MSVMMNWVSGLALSALSFSAFANTQTVKGSGKWRTSDGQKGECKSTMTITAAESNSFEISSAFECGRWKNKTAWTAVFSSEDAFDVVAGGAVVGSGYCFGLTTPNIACHLTANFSGYEVEETIQILSSGKTINKLGSFKGAGLEGFWTENLAR